jgi:tyrosine-protein phosphatase non-receptor type 4
MCIAKQGGSDQQLPVLVSRVAPNSPAETAIPKLSEGDQVLGVNGTQVDSLSHDEVVSLIRGTKDSKPGGELVLLVRPNGQFIFFLSFAL